MLNAVQLRQLRGYVRNLSDIGMPFGMAATYAADWLRARNLDISMENLKAAFGEFIDD